MTIGVAIESQQERRDTAQGPPGKTGNHAGWTFRDTGFGTVLLVEDGEPVRALASRVLSGFVATEVGHQPEDFLADLEEFLAEKCGGFFLQHRSLCRSLQA